MYAVKEADQSYRLAPIERFVARIAQAGFWHRISLSSFVAAGITFALVLHTIATLRYIETDPLIVEQRQLGDPVSALELIQQEHFISVTELNELTEDPTLDRFDRMAYAHAPIFLDALPISLHERFERVDDVPIGVYYTYSVTTYGDTELVHIEYWMYFSDENSGMSSENRVARWGHPLDRELVFRLNLLNGEVFGAEFQAPIHQLRSFIFPEYGRPIFRIASGNHNFLHVHPEELELLNMPFELVAPLPQYERASLPIADPDIMALAAQEAALQHNVDMSHFVYVGIEDPAYILRDPYPSVVSIGVMAQGRWIYLHSSIGQGVVVWGYRLVAIDMGFSLTAGDIEAVKLIVGSPLSNDRPELQVVQIFLYPELRIPT